MRDVIEGSFERRYKNPDCQVNGDGEVEGPQEPYSTVDDEMCSGCDGKGRIFRNGVNITCPDCNGSGTQRGMLE